MAQRYWFWYKKSDGTINSGSSASQEEAEKDIGKSNILIGQLGSLPVEPTTTSKEETTTILGQEVPVNQVGSTLPEHSKSLTKEQVAKLYQDYFKREPTQEEYNYWIGKDGAILTDKLSGTVQFEKEKNPERWEEEKPKEGEKPVEGETAQEKIEREKKEADEAQAKQDEYVKNANAVLDQALKDGRLSPEEYELFKTVIQYYPPGVEVNPEEILTTFKKISETTIDPHFAELTKIATTSLQQNLKYLEEQRKLEKETETLKSQQNIEAQKRSLEAAGMTFTGEGVKQLGEESAFGQQGTEAVPQIYGQMPVGMTQQTNRLLQSSSLAQYNQQVLEQARSGEAQLGTAGMTGISVPGGYDVMGGITGSLPTEEETAKGTYLQNLLTQAGKRSAYSQNINLNY